MVLPSTINVTNHTLITTMAENWIEREHKMPLIMIWMIINDEDVGDDDKDALPVTPRSVSSD